VHRPQGRLHRESETDEEARREGRAARGGVRRSYRDDVEGAGLGPHEQEAHEHQRRPGHGEDQEPGRGLSAGHRVVGVAPSVDDEPHRDQRDLEEHEEQHHVEREEAAEDTGLDHQQQDRQRGGPGRSALGVGRGVTDQRHHARGEHQRGHQHQGRGDPVDPELPVDVEGGEPDRVDGAARGAEPAVVRRSQPHRPGQGGERPDDGQPDREALTPCGEPGQQRERGGDGDETVEQDRCHAPTPAATARAQAPTRTTIR
jgi:hypothetical protein